MAKEIEDLKLKLSFVNGCHLTANLDDHLVGLNFRTVEKLTGMPGAGLSCFKSMNEWNSETYTNGIKYGYLIQLRTMGSLHH